MRQQRTGSQPLKRETTSLALLEWATRQEEKKKVSTPQAGNNLFSPVMATTDQSLIGKSQPLKRETTSLALSHTLAVSSVIVTSQPLKRETTSLAAEKIQSIP